MALNRSSDEGQIQSIFQNKLQSFLDSPFELDQMFALEFI